MNINYKWGFYIDNKLVLIDAPLNIDFEYYKKLKHLLRVESLKDASLVRIGGEADGGYIMIDSLKKSRIAYSFGINNDVAWDSAMVDKGYEVFMYDHTIENLPYDRDGFNFFKEGIAGKSDTENLCDTLENFIKRNGHATKTNMVLKMDVEGAEWDFLETVPVKVLRQFDQIVMEMHNLVRACSKEEMERRFNCLHKLNATHQLVHLHANNTAYLIQMYGTTLPDVIEVMYANRDRYKTVESKNLLLPTSLDRPCDPNREDIFLGYWNKPLSENMYEVEF